VPSDFCSTLYIMYVRLMCGLDYPPCDKNSYKHIPAMTSKGFLNPVLMDGIQSSVINYVTEHVFINSTISYIFRLF
jgi:hypothetical protein